MIQTENLSMFYGPVCALDNVSLEIAKGEVIGLLGPNGAGKSTTLKVITTYLYPTHGTAYVGGRDVRHDPMPIRKMIGYLPEQLPIYHDMEVKDYLRFVGNSRGLYGMQLKKRLEWVVEKCGLKLMYRKIIRELSKGYKQRTALAQALIHDPEIIILDEPTSGLDPHQILEIRDLIRELAGEKTVVFSSHILQEVEAVSNRIVIINKGQIVADGSKETLQNTSMDLRRMELTLLQVNNPQEIQEVLIKLPPVKQVQIRTQDNGKVVYRIEGEANEETQQQISQLAAEQNWRLYELKNTPFSLEEVFLTLTKPDKEKMMTKGATQ